MYPHVLGYGCRHFVARQLAIIFRVAFVSTLRTPSTEATKGVKCRRCLMHASKYIFFFARSAYWRQFSSVFSKWDLASVFKIRMLWSLSVPFCQRSLMRRSTFCSMDSSGGMDDVDLELAGFAFGLFTAQPAKMGGSSRTWVGVKAFPDRSATLSRRLLWRAITRLPRLQ